MPSPGDIAVCINRAKDGWNCDLHSGCYVLALEKVFMVDPIAPYAHGCGRVLCCAVFAFRTRGVGTQVWHVRLWPVFAAKFMYCCC